MTLIKLFVLDHGDTQEWIVASSKKEAIKFYRLKHIGAYHWQEIVRDHCGYTFQHRTYKDFLEYFIKEEDMNRIVQWNREEDMHGDPIERPMRDHVLEALRMHKEFPMYFGSTEW